MRPTSWLSRVAQLLPESILHSNKEKYLNKYSPRLATSAAAPGWAFINNIKEPVAQLQYWSNESNIPERSISPIRI
jgi:hypothetical protein